MPDLKRLLTITALGIVILVAVLGGALSERLFGYRVLDRFFPRPVQITTQSPATNQRILTEESVVIDVAENVSPSVVTVGISKTQRSMSLPGFEEFPSFFGYPSGQQSEQKIEQDIATGFILTSDGLIVTNKHVVSDTQAKYRVITKDNKTYDVQKIYRDPTNDIAILKIEANGLKPVEMGDSSKLKVGQFVIAIGTALGEFRHTVTTGVVSGLGRGITAGSPFEGSVEKLDDVIQTDAAINPGNSGGPLLNSGGQVIGISVATASQGQNIGFAIPINVVKASIDNFNKTGQFSRPYLGVRYRIISKDVSIMNDVPEGAYIVEIISGSPAEKAGLKPGDIITNIDEQRIAEGKAEIAKIISGKKVGDLLSVTYWREGKESKVTVTLTEAQ
ncbi:MAG: trypsin-like peptidase domain-containing protein [bacterium]|nr:trypsin-like peptidase domain-containing protein [bacterium]